MSLVARIVVALVLLGIAGFCMFGFLATFEPMEQSTLALRGVYGAVGAACVVAAIWSVFRQNRKK